MRDRDDDDARYIVASIQDPAIDAGQTGHVFAELFAAIWEHSGSNASTLIDAIRTGDTTLVIATTTDQPGVIPENVHLVRTLFNSSPNLFLHGTIYWARAYPMESGWSIEDESAFLVHAATR